MNSAAERHRVSASIVRHSAATFDGSRAEASGNCREMLRLAALRSE